MMWSSRSKCPERCLFCLLFPNLDCVSVAVSKDPSQQASAPFSFLGDAAVSMETALGVALFSVRDSPVRGAALPRVIIIHMGPLLSVVLLAGCTKHGPLFLQLTLMIGQGGAGHGCFWCPSTQNTHTGVLGVWTGMSSSGDLLIGLESHLLGWGQAWKQFQKLAWRPKKWVSCEEKLNDNDQYPLKVEVDSH